MHSLVLWGCSLRVQTFMANLAPLLPCSLTDTRGISLSYGLNPPSPLPARLPLMPLRGRVLLPHGIVRVVVTSPRSVALLEALRAGRGQIFGLGEWKAQSLGRVAHTSGFRLPCALCERVVWHETLCVFGSVLCHACMCRVSAGATLSGGDTPNTV